MISGFSIIKLILPFLNGSSIIIYNDTIVNLLRDILSTINILLVSFFLLFYIDKKPFLKTIGLSFNHKWHYQLWMGFFRGAIFISIIFIIYLLVGISKISLNTLSLINIFSYYGINIIFLVISTIFEEVLFRGYIFQILIEGIGKKGALLITSILFSLFHINTPSYGFIAFINIMAIGILLGIYCLKTEALWMAIGFHFGVNFFEGLIFAFNTSGCKWISTFLVNYTTGPKFITGGLLGPEGGLVFTLITILLYRNIILKKGISGE